MTKPTGQENSAGGRIAGAFLLSAARAAELPLYSFLL